MIPPLVPSICRLSSVAQCKTSAFLAHNLFQTKNIFTTRSKKSVPLIQRMYQTMSQPTKMDCPQQTQNILHFKNQIPGGNINYNQLLETISNKNLFQIQKILNLKEFQLKNFDSMNLKQMREIRKNLKRLYKKIQLKKQVSQFEDKQSFEKELAIVLGNLVSQIQSVLECGEKMGYRIGSTEVCDMIWIYYKRSEYASAIAIWYLATKSIVDTDPNITLILQLVENFVAREKFAGIRIDSLNALGTKAHEYAIASASKLADPQLLHAIYCIASKLEEKNTSMKTWPTTQAITYMMQPTTTKFGGRVFAADNFDPNFILCVATDISLLDISNTKRNECYQHLFYSLLKSLGNSNLVQHLYMIGVFVGTKSIYKSPSKSTSKGIELLISTNLHFFTNVQLDGYAVLIIIRELCKNSRIEDAKQIIELCKSKNEKRMQEIANIYLVAISNRRNLQVLHEGIKYIQSKNIQPSKEITTTIINGLLKTKNSIGIKLALQKYQNLLVNHDFDIILADIMIRRIFELQIFSDLDKQQFIDKILQSFGNENTRLKYTMMAIYNNSNVFNKQSSDIYEHEISTALSKQNGIGNHELQTLTKILVDRGLVTQALQLFVSNLDNENVFKSTAHMIISEFTRLYCMNKDLIILIQNPMIKNQKNEFEELLFLMYSQFPKRILPTCYLAIFQNFVNSVPDKFNSEMLVSFYFYLKQHYFEFNNSTIPINKRCRLLIIKKLLDLEHQELANTVSLDLNKL
ncbi:hypothetical protein BB558_000841 [Smittium angustum]|uniref:Uncharacterized protein n=1 Tax=Smittium angustum TaxID=133377 RepID=A0A2U1JD17_SMIAN|nr:hypothetical protein BB558_000841 [Smittium angustum]